MTEINYSLMLRELVDDYFARRISRVEYLAQRHILMERIDRDFNGEDITNNRPPSDITQPKKAVFKDSDDESDTAITNVPTNIKHTDNR